MYYADHGVAHFHADYSGEECSIAIETLEVLEGNIPNRAYNLIRTWADMHRDELAENWRRAREGEPLAKIDPLD
jgi:hypothetical protein